MNDYQALFKDYPPYWNQQTESNIKNVQGAFNREKYDDNVKVFGPENWEKLTRADDIWDVPHYKNSF